MGKKVYFLDSVEQSDGNYDNTYGVDDVNAIVSNLVGAGVAPFPSGDTYDVSELNSLTSALVAEGTSLDGLKVSFAENKIHIAQGIGYFENGATIVVDSDGEELDYNVAETLYVYAEYNQALNTCGFYTSESEPTSSTGIYVLVLATIAADGTVADKRVFAQSKVATLGRNVTKNVIVKGNADTAAYFGEGAIVYQFDFDTSKFNSIYFKGTADKEITSFIKIQDVLDVSEGEYTGYDGDDGIRVYHVSPGGYSTSDSLFIRYKNGKLQLYVPTHEGYRYWDWYLCLKYLTATFY